ncbi:hypothetical protein JCM3774_002708 [Rhodotorula dairenensis]
MRRTELRELHILREMLMSKGGRDFALACIDNTDGIVPERVTSKLVVQTPPVELVDLYLHEIAKAYSVDWQPESAAVASKGPEGTVTEPVRDRPVAADDPSSPLSPTSAEAAPSTATDSTVPLRTAGGGPPVSSNGGAGGGKTHSIPPFDTDLPQTPPVDPSRADSATIVRTNLAANETAASGSTGSSSAPGPALDHAASNSNSNKAKEKDEDAFEALQRRFAELKRK